LKPDRILDEIVGFYVQSKDFNGIPLDELPHRLRCSWPDLLAPLVQLIKAKKVTLTFSSVFVNPHIKAFPDLSPSQQIQKLKSEGPVGICAYPTASVIQSAVNVAQYEDRPFTKRLVLGEPQLLPLYFDLTVLERYYADPRYQFEFRDYYGSISISDLYYESESLPQRDKVFLKTFGLGYDPQDNRVVCVFLRYLFGLSPEHQQVWNAYLLPTACKMADDYYRNTILGEWAEGMSIYEAFLQEQVCINDMSRLIGRPPLFRETYRDDRPRQFSLFLRPTRSNYYNFILLLDKLISSNINKDFFRGEIPLDKEIHRRDGKIESQQRGTLTLLNDWLRTKWRVEDDSGFEEIVQPLKKVRTLRQKPVYNISEDEFDPEYYRKQEELMVEVYGALRLIRLLFANHPKVRGYKVPDWLYKGKIKPY